MPTPASFSPMTRRRRFLTDGRAGAHRGVACRARPSRRAPAHRPDGDQEARKSGFDRAFWLAAILRGVRGQERRAQARRVTWEPLFALTSLIFIWRIKSESQVHGARRLIRSAALLALVLSAGRRVAAALAYRDFRLLWLGALTSSIGTWMQKVAQAWLIVTLTGASSAFFLGLDSFVGELPILLLTLIGGVVADRYNRRRLMLMSQCIQMAAAFILAALVFFGVARIWHILVLSAITGFAQAFGGPAYQSLIPLLVAKDHLPNAIALNSIQFNLARVIGPIVAGAALATFGMVACFGLNGLSFLFVIAAILALHVVHAPERSTARLRDKLKGGLQYVRSQPPLIT